MGSTPQRKCQVYSGEEDAGRKYLQLWPVVSPESYKNAGTNTPAKESDNYVQDERFVLGVKVIGYSRLLHPMSVFIGSQFFSAHIF